MAYFLAELLAPSPRDLWLERESRLGRNFALINLRHALFN